MAGRGRPSAEQAERRERAITTKVNDAEGAAWDALLTSMTSTGPRPRDADALRWLIEQECKRRGIAWPGATPQESSEELVTSESGIRRGGMPIPDHLREKLGKKG